jgi:hypothetical protein
MLRWRQRRILQREGNANFPERVQVFEIVAQFSDFAFAAIATLTAVTGLTGLATDRRTLPREFRNTRAAMEPRKRLRLTRFRDRLGISFCDHP